MDLNLIMSDMPAFRGVEYTPTYAVVNKKKYKGKNKKLAYKSKRELDYMKELDEDVDDNLVQWSYKRVKVHYIDAHTGKKEWFYPSFYLMTKGKELSEKPPIDSPYKEYLIHMLSPEETTQAELLDEDDYNELSPEDKQWYDYNLLREQYNFMRFDAAKKYCKENGMEFMVNCMDGVNIGITEKPIFN